MTGRELVSQLDSAIERRHLLKHRSITNGGRGRSAAPKLQLYAAQHCWHVEAFPVHLKDLSGRTTGRLHDVVPKNLAEEEDPVRAARETLARLCRLVGLNEESLWFSAPLAGVETLLRIYRKICREHPTAEAVVALYAYEAQVPGIATSKIEGCGVTTA
jgi:pyrroloquinoline-quinone synthase